MSAAGDCATAYFDRVRARDPAAIAGMFAEDGRLTMPDGMVLVGRAVILDFYRAAFAKAPPTPRITRLISQDDVCAAELSVTRANGSFVRVVDVFELGPDGLIVSLRIYRQGS